MKVKIKVYDQCKFNKESKKVGEIEYNIVDYQVVEKTDDEIYSEGFDTVDPHRKYLIIRFDDMSSSTFCNSFVDMFII